MNCCRRLDTVGEWAAIISDEKPTINNNGPKSNNNIKDDNDKKEHHPKFGEAFNQFEKEDLRALKLKIANTSKNLTKFEHKDLNDNNIPNSGLLSEKQALSLYKEISDNCLRGSFPLTLMPQLVTSGSCIPLKHPEDDVSIQNISHSLYQWLMTAMQSTNKEMLEMLSVYQQSRNRYRA